MSEALAFEPSIVCGGGLNLAKYEARRDACTSKEVERLQADPDYLAWKASRDRAHRRTKLGRLFRQLPAVAVLLLILASGLATAWLTSYQLPISFQSLKPRGLSSLRSFVTELYRTPSAATPTDDLSHAAAQTLRQDTELIFAPESKAPAQDPSLRALQEGARSLQASTAHLNEIFHSTPSQTLQHSVGASGASATREAALHRHTGRPSIIHAASIQQLTPHTPGTQQAAGRLADAASASALQGSQAASQALHGSVNAASSALHATGSSFKQASRKAIALQDLPGNLAAQVAYRAAFLWFMSEHKLLAGAQAAGAWGTGVLHSIHSHISYAWQMLQQYTEDLLRYPPKPLHTAWSFLASRTRQLDAACKQSRAWQWLARRAPSLQNATSRPQWTKDVLHASYWQPDALLGRLRVAQLDLRHSLWSHAHWCTAHFSRAYRTGVQHLWHGVTKVAAAARAGLQQLQRVSPSSFTARHASSPFGRPITELWKAGIRMVRAGQHWMQAVASRCHKDLSQGGPLRHLASFKASFQPSLKGHLHQVAASLQPHLPVISGAVAACAIVLLAGGVHRKFVPPPGEKQSSTRHVFPLQPSDFSAVIPMEPLAPQTPQVQDSDGAHSPDSSRASPSAELRDHHQTDAARPEEAPLALTQPKAFHAGQNGRHVLPASVYGQQSADVTLNASSGRLASPLTAHQNGSAHAAEPAGGEQVQTSDSSTSTDDDSSPGGHPALLPLVEMIADVPTLPPIATPTPQVTLPRPAAAASHPSVVNNAGRCSAAPQAGPPQQHSHIALQLDPSLTPFSAGKPGLASLDHQGPHNLLSEFERASTRSADVRPPASGNTLHQPGDDSSHADRAALSHSDAGPSGLTPEERLQLQSEVVQPSPFARVSSGASSQPVQPSAAQDQDEGSLSPGIGPNPKREVAEQKRRMERAGSSSCWATIESGPIDQAAYDASAQCNLNPKIFAAWKSSPPLQAKMPRDRSKSGHKSHKHKSRMGSTQAAQAAVSSSSIQPERQPDDLQEPIKASHSVHSGVQTSPWKLKGPLAKHNYLDTDDHDGAASVASSNPAQAGSPQSQAILAAAPAAAHKQADPSPAVIAELEPSGLTKTPSGSISLPWQAKPSAASAAGDVDTASAEAADIVPPLDLSNHASVSAPQPADETGSVGTNSPEDFRSLSTAVSESADSLPGSMSSVSTVGPLSSPRQWTEASVRDMVKTLRMMEGEPRRLRRARQPPSSSTSPGLRANLPSSPGRSPQLTGPSTPDPTAEMLSPNAMLSTSVTFPDITPAPQKQARQSMSSRVGTGNRGLFGHSRGSPRRSEPQTTPRKRVTSAWADGPPGPGSAPVRAGSKSVRWSDSNVSSPSSSAASSPQLLTMLDQVWSGTPGI